MWWAKAGDWSAKAVDQFLGQDAAHKANRTNIRLARENREFQERMFERSVELDNTAVQRHVKDLSAAGLNPMLGYTGQAASPSAPAGSVARVEPTYESGKESANPRVQEAMFMESQRRLLDAQARSTSADAALKEAEIPFSARSAESRFDKLFKEAELLSAQIAGKRLENMQMDELRPLLVDAQRLANQAERLGMSEREAASKFFKTTEDASQWLYLLKMAIGSARGVVGPR